ncbi:patellin-1 [Drosophila grimshawi]|uniref:GH19947 n=1 Tax=Drosophila grimshawi TaxID=7222 RepID=B4J8I5_DROGR|nr:patellin-1 [Drosophila grimshawi]EDW02344.1 GH19947 [Drosophila grimshawi]
MFKLVICLFVVASGVSGGPIDRKDVTTEKREIIPLLSFESERNPDGSFKFAYEGGDQTFRQESGVVENAGTDEEALEISGSYRYIDADGQVVEVHYTAGKNGFVPSGTNIAGEITQLAKNAASLPNYTEEQERESRLSQRRARSQSEPEPVIKTETEEKKESAQLTAAEPKPAESQTKTVTVAKAEEKKSEEKTEEKTEEKKPEEKKTEEKKPEEKKAEEKKEEKLSTAVEPKAAVSEVVPVQVVVEQKPVAEKLESDKIESKTA